MLAFRGVLRPERGGGHMRVLTCAALGVLLRLHGSRTVKAAAVSAVEAVLERYPNFSLADASVVKLRPQADRISGLFPSLEAGGVVAVEKT